MTPKEKSKELVYRYWDIEDIDFLKAKQCALIAVDEIIEVTSKYSIHSDCSEDASFEFWKEVKQEIELL